jgi:hypothetical protein
MFIINISYISFFSSIVVLLLEIRCLVCALLPDNMMIYTYLTESRDGLTDGEKLSLKRETHIHTYRRARAW